MKSNKTTLVMIAAVVVTASAFAFGQGAWSPTGSATDTGGRSATAAGQPGYIEPSTGFVNPGVPTNGAYLPPFGSPNSANGAPSGAVGNTGANGVVGGGQSYNAVGGTNPGGRTAGTTAGTSSGVTTPVGAAPTVGAGSPQASGPLNSAPNGAAGTYGYPNGVDPNGSLNNSGATFRNTEAGRATTSGTT
ncbi:MAG: hypothetical protein EOP05_21225, partial [Proteobacteria bacterium]